MFQHNHRSVNSIENLRGRVDRLFKTNIKRSNVRSQLSLDLPLTKNHSSTNIHPSNNIVEFLNFITYTLGGEVYLFGGVLRDLALQGKKGFNSDIDIVVEGNWSNCVTYLESLGARKNKFGGYRLEVAGWPIDIWNAKETWAIKQGLVQYKGIASLTETTVLNWDAILMNWRTRTFVYRKNYLDEIKSKFLDIVLEKNPDTLGMAVRVFRHLCLRDTDNLSLSAKQYLANCAKTYSFDEIKNREINSYGNSVILPGIFKYYEQYKLDDKLSSRLGIPRDIIKPSLPGF